MIEFVKNSLSSQPAADIAPDYAGATQNSKPKTKASTISTAKLLAVGTAAVAAFQSLENTDITDVFDKVNASVGLPFVSIALIAGFLFMKKIGGKSE